MSNFKMENIAGDRNWQKVNFLFQRKDRELVDQYYVALSKKGYKIQLIDDIFDPPIDSEIRRKLFSQVKPSQPVLAFITEENSLIANSIAAASKDYWPDGSDQPMIYPLILDSIVLDSFLEEFFWIKISTKISEEKVSEIDLALQDYFVVKENFSTKSEYYATNKSDQQSEESIKSVANENIQNYPKQSYITKVNTDSPAIEIIDQLDFESDINALAALMAYNEVKPPLAIGLFGNWGSGKSFFMNKLQQRIRFLSESNPETYCKEVIHVQFNSWHYSDSNLWASLATKIFEEINKLGEKEPERLKNLIKELHSSRELEKEAQRKKEYIDNEINSLQLKLNIVEDEINKNSEELKGISLRNLSHAILSNEVVSEAVKKLKDQYAQLDLEAIDQLQANISTLDTWYKRIKESLKLLGTFLKGNRALFLLIAVLLIGGSYFLIDLWPIFAALRGKVIQYIIPFTLFFSQCVAFLSPHMKRVNQVWRGLISLKQTCDSMEARLKNQQNEERDYLQSAIESGKHSRTEIQVEIDQLKVQQDQLQTELDDIYSGKKILRFIESRVSDPRYINSLGIISWIRKDFEELDFLLKQQYDANKLEELNRKPVDNVFKIDRIILYIDDLDRCEVATVVRVLEAIHLLLAFPLFVVIVGVDPRWVHNALKDKYSALLKENSNQADQSQNEGFIQGKVATTYDYLEKIFQIPFVLKPMTNENKKRLIIAQFEPSVPKQVKDQNTDKNKEHPFRKLVYPGMESMSSPDVDIKSRQSPVPLANPDAGNQETIAAETTKSLEISKEEIDFMQAMNFMLGESPRTIKRYINLYRLIRTHAKFRFVDQNKMEHYYAAMILLGILTGFPMQSKLIFQKIKSETDDITFISLLNSITVSNNADYKLISELVHLIENNAEYRPIGDIKMNKFKANIDLVSRFSFRMINVI
jgi:hypothetical protein